jgi:hypothetical protein
MKNATGLKTLVNQVVAAELKKEKVALNIGCEIWSLHHDIEGKYFSIRELLLIESKCNGNCNDKKGKDLVVNIMKHLNTRGFLTKKQKWTILAIVGQKCKCQICTSSFNNTHTLPTTRPMKIQDTLPTISTHENPGSN